MSTRKVSLVDGEYYHVYNRGNSKQEIFLDTEDKDRFLKLLYLCNSVQKINFREMIVRNKIDAWDFDRGECIVSIGAWVIMPNHFHLYIKSKPLANPLRLQKEGVNNIAIFLGRVCNAYAKYFNAKYQRTGSLFEGKFKSVHIDDEVQAKYLFSYIHLNPIKLIQSNWKENGLKDKEKALKFLDSYKWGSYLDYLNIKRKENLLLDKDNFLNYFSTEDKFKKEILEWFNHIPTLPTQGVGKGNGKIF